MFGWFRFAKGVLLLLFVFYSKNKECRREPEIKHKADYIESFNVENFRMRLSNFKIFHHISSRVMKICASLMTFFSTKNTNFPIKTVYKFLIYFVKLQKYRPFLVVKTRVNSCNRNKIVQIKCDWEVSTKKMG